MEGDEQFWHEHFALDDMDRWSTGGLQFAVRTFFRLHWFEPMGNTTPSAWIPLWSGFYYAINVTSSLALVEYQPTHPICQAVVILNVIVGYLFLGIGIGMVGRMMQIR